MRSIAFAIALLVSLTQTTAAFAHASLLRAEPAEGATLAEPPRVLKLTFNEPVAPLVMRLIGPSGEVIASAAAAENAVVTITPPPLGRGTHALSWRVVSADGHPIGGSLVFSVGAPSPVQPRRDEAGDPLVARTLWAAKVVIYAGLFIGIGGVFFWAWLADPKAALRRHELAAVAVSATLAAGLFATLVSVGLQGLDALALPFSSLAQASAWRTGLATAHGVAAITAAIAILLAVVAWATNSVGLRRALSALAVFGVGLGLSLSGHAGTVEPRLLTRSAVFVHGVCVAMWIGAFVPLLAAIGHGNLGRDALARFTRFIPYPLAVLLAIGAALAFVQLDRVDALWTTRYGAVLSCKLAATAALLALGAANRFMLVPRFEAHGGAASRPLARSIAGELAIALGILALVALWRFTPPPRALVSGEHVSIHFHGDRAMTHIEIEPRRARGAEVDVEVLDIEQHPLAIKELSLVFSDPAGRIESLRRRANSAGGSNWRIDDLRIPIAGIWRLRVEILINDFDKETIEDQVQLPRAP